MRQRDLIHDFVRGCTRGKASELYVDNDKLIYYSTTLLQRCGHDYIFNYNKYLRLTSRLQSWIIRDLNAQTRNIIVLYDCERIKKGSFTCPVHTNIDSQQITIKHENIDYGVKDLIPFTEITNKSEVDFVC